MRRWPRRTSRSRCASIRTPPGPPTASSRPSWSARSATSGGTILRSGRSDSFGRRSFPETGPRTELVELGFAEGIEDHATLVAGSWPVPVSVEEAAADTAAIPVAISENIAVPQGLAVGDRVRLPSRIDPEFTAPWLSPRSSGSTIPPTRSGGTTPRCSMARSRASASRPTGPSSRRPSGSGHARRPRPSAVHLARVAELRIADPRGDPRSQGSRRPARPAPRGPPWKASR